MIVVYTSPGCASCRKVKKWLNDHHLEFIEKNIFKTLLDDQEIKELLMRTENGTDDIISKRSKLYQEKTIDFDNMKTNELIEFIRQNPSILRRPIIIDDRCFLVGYDEDEIDAFIPPELRNMNDLPCSKSCPNFETCGRYKNND